MDFQQLVESLNRTVTDIVNFIPRLLNGLIILVIGYLIARLVRWLVGTILRRLSFDPVVERTGVTGTLRGLGVKMPLSRIIEQTAFFLLLIAFLITATRLMGLEAVARLLEQLLSYLPSLIAAAILFLLGGIAAKFMGDVVTAAATGAGLTYAPRLGRLVQYLISVIVVVLTLSVLGIDTGLLVTAVTIALAAFGLALGLALGLGARSLVHHILSGYYIRQRFTARQSLGFGDIRGEVRGIGSVNTVVGTEQGDVVIPNGTLLESIVQAPGPAPAQEANS